jgi:hypothetical protein
MSGYVSTAQVMVTILPPYQQDAHGRSPAAAGLAMIAIALPLFAYPTIGGKFGTRLSGRAML